MMNINTTGKGSSQSEEPPKKKSKTTHEQESAQSAAEEISLDMAADMESLDELAKALEEANELRERHLRLKAEWDNYRKRTESERADERSRAAQHLVEKLLPIMDDLERAIDHSDGASEESLKDGVAQVCGKLQGVLSTEGVKVINPQGEPFDANLHSAISKVEDKKVPDETVLEVYQKGYVMGSRVLRPAMVVVSCK